MFLVFLFAYSIFITFVKTMIFCYDSYRNPHWLYKNICSKDPQLTLHHDQYDINNNILYTCLSVSLPINTCFIIANESPNLSLKSPSVIIDAPKISPGSVWNCLELCGHYSDFPACLPSDLQSFKRPSHSIALSKAHI